VDAALAARRLVAGEGLSLPRGGGGRREDLRLLLLERRGAMQARNAALNPAPGCRLSRVAFSTERETSCAIGRQLATPPDERLARPLEPAFP
jgi:hypothetical protein